MLVNNCENLRSLSVNDLIYGEDNKTYCFIIPSYQRGYRWDKEQINKLLDDLLEFQKSKEAGDATVGDFYCLQPIVVKQMFKPDIFEKMGKDYAYKEDVAYMEVVDGQQRLTTIYILLKYLQTRTIRVFALEYERDAKCNFTRRRLLESLSFNTNTDTLDASTADEYYFVESFKIIKDWFDMQEKLLKNNSICNNMQSTLEERTKVIWYELSSDTSIDCYSVFKNINNGKIPLTDAELVKAMLLNRKYFSPKLDDKVSNDKIIRQEQERYARLWDEIQRTLSNDNLWSFITGNYRFNLPTRIDYLFKIDVRQKKPEKIQGGDLSLFSYYERELNEKPNMALKREYIESIFENIRKMYRTIQDWYGNYEIYNFIGYIMTYKGRDGYSKISQIVSLLARYENKNRTEFVESLKDEIKKDFDNYTLESINYNDNSKEVEKLLMLFNIMELNAVHKRFNFAVGSGGWSVEHIKAQHSKIAKDADRIVYLEKERNRIDKIIQNERNKEKRAQYQKIVNQVNDIISHSSLNEKTFTNIAESIAQQIDGFGEFDMHSLGNLALLSKMDNSVFNNSPFYEKRQKMLYLLNKASENIPYATVKIFLKMYSPQDYSLDFTKWSKSDVDYLFLRQRELLKYFIKEQ